ncbi:MAG: peptidase domain-containing ABC transporter [Gammaproteobacteria bacterium]|nr:peptidase domain-containing ABC transporter [Rhodocyclaceae bacterium]MBU3908173.1 peptidase domain-containing ABC transporter [Gammaproteobacteria bacterium]MBU4003749.1 peptidase domain-containing ABC transporter [Gammaproteobacteria bacterium]MBU4022174.1 peptidase domain-containing ABC transporter [Gammaproteobacteria bacterium]MBU4096837.1 peptidase domain-containing ABC transporter [Gammaproteobacteria bacterium]
MSTRRRVVDSWVGEAVRAVEYDGKAVLWALAAACQLQRIPFDPQLVLQQYPPPHSIEAVREALVALGFRSGFSDVGLDQLSEIAAPCFLTLKQTDEAPLAFALLLRCDGERILYVEPGSQEPREVDLAEFAPRYAGQALQFAREAAPVADPDIPPGPKAFGFSWFVPELLKHRSIWRDILLASLAIQLVGLATPLFTQVVIDKVVVHQTISTLTVIGIGLFGAMVFSALMTWVRQYLVLHTGNRVDAVLGTRVFEHLFALSPRYFEHRATGVIVARLHGVETIREFVAGAAVSLMLDIPFLFIFLAIMFWYSWQLSLIAVGLLGAVAVLSILVAPVIRSRLNRQFLIGARNQAFLTEYVAGFETVKSLQMEPKLRGHYGDYIAEYLAATFRARQLSNTYSVAANGLEQMMTLAILVVGAWLVMQNDGFTVGMLVAFQMFAGRLSQPLLRLVGLWQEFQQAGIAVKRLGDIMNAPAEPCSLVPQRGKREGSQIEIENIAFRYAQELPWLYRNLSITLDPGRCLALMGPSGSGKSTLAKLLQGFYFPEEGRIAIDGQDLRYLAANELRNHFGVVPQETILFSGTLYENLILANPRATFEQVVQACQWAEIHDTIEKLPKGYQTEVGERGVGLSGGQKQRIAIARALLKQPRVLIFDEATANLDPQTAEHFARTINKFKGKVTMLFIAHQLPKGLQVDEVVTLGEHGAMVAVVQEQKNG